jgi:ABC-2 type transport system permease protein
MHNRLRFIWRQMNVQLQTRALSWETLGLLFVQPIVFSGVGFALARIAGSESEDIIYTIVGGGVMGLWSGMLFTSFYDITRDRTEGTLELIVGSPTSLNTILAVRILTNILTGALSLVGFFLVAALWFHLSFTNVSPLALIVSFMIILFAFWCIGVLLANFRAWSRASGSFINYLEMPIAVIGCFMFPANVLPVWLLPLSSILPLRWAVAALNGSLDGSSAEFIFQNWLLALGLSVLYLMMAFWLSGKVHNKIRVSGELSSI